MVVASQIPHATQLFLLNDVVISLENAAVPRRVATKGFGALSLDAVLNMGREVYAAEPLLHRVRPRRAVRLASLISAKAPLINGALFLAPYAGCPWEEVTVRLAESPLQVMLDLYDRQQEGPLDTLSTDRRVWKRLAA